MQVQYHKYHKFLTVQGVRYQPTQVLCHKYHTLYYCTEDLLSTHTGYSGTSIMQSLTVLYRGLRLYSHTKSGIFDTGTIQFITLPYRGLGITQVQWYKKHLILKVQYCTLRI
jgi:hypothetical protein